MLQFSGLDALEVLKQSGLDVPFILVSGKIGEENVVKIMRMGARDYLMKDHLELLCPVIERELQEAREAIRRGEQDATFTYPAGGKQGAYYALQTLIRPV